MAIAHYHCELAEAAIAERDFDGARDHLRRARQEQRDFGRSAILRGDLARMQGDPQLALQLYRRVVRRDFHLLALVLPRLADAAKQAGERRGVRRRRWRELLQNGLASRSEIAYAAIVSGYYDDPVILDCVREWLSADNDLKDITERAAARPAPSPATSSCVPWRARCATSCCATRAIAAASAASTARASSGSARAASPGRRCAASRRWSSCRARPGRGSG